MAFNEDFSGGIPANMLLVGGSLSGSTILIPQDAYIKTIDGSVTSTSAFDITITVKSDPADDNVTFNLVGLFNDPISYYASVKLGVYGTTTIYRATSTTATVIASNILNFSDIGDYFDIRFTHDGQGGVKVYVNGTINATGQDSSLPPSIYTGNAQIISTGGTVILDQFTAIEYITSLSTYTPKVGDPITIFGGPFGSTIGTNVIRCGYDGTVEDMSSHVVSWSDTEIVFNLNVIRMPLIFNVAVEVIGASLSGVALININAATDKLGNTVVDPIYNTVGVASIFDGYLGDTPISGFQMEYDDIPEFTLNPNGTYEYSGIATSVPFTVRVWSSEDFTWSSTATLSITNNPNISHNLEDLEIVTSYTNGTDSRLRTTVGDGTVYIINTLSSIKPSIDQIVNGQNADGSDAVFSVSIPVSSIGYQNFTARGYLENVYYFYAVHIPLDGISTNIGTLAYSVAGDPVYPVITTQPTNGSVQESKPSTSHTFSVVASPVKFYQWYSKPPLGSFSPIEGATRDTLTVNGDNFDVADDATEYKCVITGLGAVTTETTTVVLSVQEMPYIDGTYINWIDDSNINFTNLDYQIQSVIGGSVLHTGSFGTDGASSFKISTPTINTGSLYILSVKNDIGTLTSLVNITAK